MRGGGNSALVYIGYILLVVGFLTAVAAFSKIFGFVKDDNSMNGWLQLLQSIFVIFVGALVSNV